MPKVMLIAADILREALARRWIVAMLAALTLAALVLAFALEFQIVDGVLAGTRLFGSALYHELSATDLVLRPLLKAASWTLYLCGVLFGALACADFAPELLMPGRIEQLLALPIRRWELVVGTYLGVLVLALGGASYAALLFTLLLGVKTGIYSLAMPATALAAVLAFSAVYGLMLLSASYVRSAALAGLLGAGLFVACLTLTLPEVAAGFDPGWKRTTYQALTAPLPRLTILARAGLMAAGLEPLTAGVWRAALSAPIFGLACVLLCVRRLERRDF
jgi:Cu-processing system permease protein